MSNSNVLAYVTLDSLCFDDDCFDSDEQKQLFLNSSEQEQKDFIKKYIYNNIIDNITINNNDILIL